MTDASVTLRTDCPAPLLPTAARLSSDAFRGKLAAALAPEEKAVAFLRDAMDGRFAVAAVSDGRLLGVAGYRVAEGGFINVTPERVARAYGWPDAPWRLELLALLDRRAEADVLVMDGIAVAPEARGRGIGSLILGAVAAEARRRGLRAVRLGVIDTNPRAASLYRRCGFTTVRRVRMGPLRHLFGVRSAEVMSRPVAGNDIV